jgi:predicted transcriptional regulator
MDNQSNKLTLIELTTDIVANYVSHNAVAMGDLAHLIHSTYQALSGLESGVSAEPEQPLVPAVPVKKSVHADYIICLEDGKQFKSLKRHLRTSYDMTPEEYRAKWGLPHDYPMVAPNYAAARSSLAKSMGLGSVRKKATRKRG